VLGLRVDYFSPVAAKNRCKVERLPWQNADTKLVTASRRSRHGGGRARAVIRKGAREVRETARRRGARPVHSQSFFANTLLIVRSIGCVGRPKPRVNSASTARIRTAPGASLSRMILTSVASASGPNDRRQLCDRICRRHGNVAFWPAWPTAARFGRNSLRLHARASRDLSPFARRFREREAGGPSLARGSQQCG
jgi:hypothetical protein